MNEGTINFFWRIAQSHPLLARLVAGAGFMRKHTYLSQSGWYDSFQHRLPVDAGGNPIPWYSFPFIRFLEERVTSKMDVFEYGCGHSTLWWSSRVAHVTFCEHDEEWYERIRDRFGDNVTGYLKSSADGSYSSLIRDYRQAFDVIIIDGMERTACARECIGALKDDGVIIWDNSDRECYQEGYDFLMEQGFRRLAFAGLGSIVMIPTETSVFYKPSNCLGI